MASLRDVAQHAGVSVATASRVISGSDGVRSETRERVERAMRELLYVPPGRRPATGMIGLLVPDLENPIFPALAQAMEERATEAGFASILCNTTAAAFREVDYVHMLLDRRQRRRCPRRRVDAVEADDRQITGDAQPLRRRLLQNADRH